MGNKTLIYKTKLQHSLNESYKHLSRLTTAIQQLQTKYSFPLDKSAYEKILQDIHDLAFSDQIIYRFSKLQDTIGAKLFKSLLLYQGEDINRPFLDILNDLEKIGLLDVEAWFEIRDLRNEIAHDYEENSTMAIDILNTIVEIKDELELLLEKIGGMIKS